VVEVGIHDGGGHSGRAVVARWACVVARWVREVLWTGGAARGTVGDCWSGGGVGGAYVGYIGDVCTCNPDVFVD
jgi:hypothetical protein